MIRNPHNPSHLQVQEFWVRIVVSSLLSITSCQIQVQVGRDNDRTYESLFFFSSIYIYIYIKRQVDSIIKREIQLAF
jgi:hypothetical protein